jgi:hypothetical protein
MRSWVSVFIKFWKFVRFQDLKALEPIIEKRLDDLEKQQEEVKQAKVFEIEQLVRFFEMPNTPSNVADKALSFGGRGAEVTFIEFGHVKREKVPQTGEIQVEVKFQRLKTKGVPEKTSALITGDIEVKVLTDYESCFSGQ